MNITTEQQAELQAYIQETSDFDVLMAVTISSTVLLAYDIILTLPREIELMSLRRLGPASILYYCARYPSLVGLTIQCSTLFLPLSTASQIVACNILYVFASVTALFVIIGIQGILAARTYTICNRNKLVLLVFVILLCISLALSLGDIIVAPLCLPSYSQAAKASKLSSFQLLSIIVSDTIVFGFITIQILKSPGLSRKTYFETFPLYRFLFEQGLMRYCFVLAITVTTFVLSKTLRMTMTGILIPIQESVSTIIVYRLSLDLRTQSAKHQVQCSHTGEKTSISVSFRHPVMAFRAMCDMVVADFGTSVATTSFTDSTIPSTVTAGGGFGRHEINFNTFSMSNLGVSPSDTNVSISEPF